MEVFLLAVVSLCLPSVVRVCPGLRRGVCKDRQSREDWGACGSL